MHIFSDLVKEKPGTDFRVMNVMNINGQNKTNGSYGKFFLLFGQFFPLSTA